MTTKRGDRPRDGLSPVLESSGFGDPRARATQAAGVGEGDILAPLGLVDGRLTVRLDPRTPLVKTAQGTMAINLGPGLQVVLGSPPHLEVAHGQSLVRDPQGRLHARPLAADIRGLVGTVESLARSVVDQATGKGAAGRATQAVSKATTVTCNEPSGQIVMNGAALASMASVVFRVACSACQAGDVPCVAISGGATSGAYLVTAGSSVVDGAFDVTIFNCSGGPLSESVILNYALLRVT